MVLFVGDYVEEVGVVFLAEAGSEEVGFGHLADALFIEDIFEMLEGKSVLKDVKVGDCLTLFNRVGEGGGGEQQGSC